MITAAASGIIASNLFFGISNFSPMSSAAINAMAKRNPPRPWFHPKLNEFGNTTSANKTGDAKIANAKMTLLFSNKQGPIRVK
jgi:hypothetical protein